ncbi:hypothetical protein KBD69_05470 [Candidatus Woesebacteria bacterium]|nr:hypothetical protein [Candidatus Woesebacteria bacterium]
MQKSSGLEAVYSGGQGTSYQPPYDLLITTTETNLARAEFKMRGRVNGKTLEIGAANLGNPLSLALWWHDINKMEHPGDIGVSSYRVLGDLVFPILALTVLTVQNPRDDIGSRLSADRLPDVERLVNTYLVEHVKAEDPTLNTNLFGMWYRSYIMIAMGEKVFFEKKLET